MSGIRSYDLSGDQVESLVFALNGNEQERTKWLNTLNNWIGYRNMQMEILKWAEQWFKDFGLATGAHLHTHEWLKEEDRLMDWVYYEMEYVSGLCWDEATESVIINKYSSSRPLLSEENIVKMLAYITEKIKGNA